MSQLICRFYSNPSPVRGDVIMVRGVRKSADNDGVYCDLLEYEGLVGFIPTREFKIRKWEGHMASYCTALLGRLVCAEVTEIGDEEDLVCLSLKRVTNDDSRLCRDRYSKGKSIQSILRRVAIQLDIRSKSEFEQLHKDTVWKYQDRNADHNSVASFDYFKKAALGDEDALDLCEVDKGILLEEIKKRLTKKAVDVSSRFEVTCFRMEGIDSIKQALSTGLECSTKEIPLKINLHSSPEYIIKTNAIDEALAVATIAKSLQTIETTIRQLGGNFKLLSKAVVTYSASTDDESDEEHEEEDSGIVV